LKWENSGKEDLGKNCAAFSFWSHRFVTISYVAAPSVSVMNIYSKSQPTGIAVTPYARFFSIYYAKKRNFNWLGTYTYAYNIKPSQ
jgi:hypothetical protein